MRFASLRWSVQTITVCLLGVALLAVFLPITQGAPAADSIRTNSSVAVPPQTVTFEGDNYTVASFSRLEADGAMRVELRAAATPYRLYVYDSDRRIQRVREYDRDRTVTLQAGDYGPGSYALAISRGGTFQTVHPFVVNPKSFTAHVRPSRAGRRGVEIQTRIGTVTGQGVSEMMLVLRNDSAVHAESIPISNANTTRRVPLRNYSPGSYSLFVSLHTDRRVLGTKEAVAISRSHRLVIGNRTDTGGAFTPRAGTPTAEPSQAVLTPAATGTTVNGPFPTGGAVAVIAVLLALFGLSLTRRG